MPLREYSRLREPLTTGEALEAEVHRRSQVEEVVPATDSLQAARYTLEWDCPPSVGSMAHKPDPTRDMDPTNSWGSRDTRSSRDMDTRSRCSKVMDPNSSKGRTTARPGRRRSRQS